MSTAAELDDAAVRSLGRHHLPTTWICTGCGYQVTPDELIRMRCSAARDGDDIDHVLRRELDLARLSFPSGAEPNPFVRYRTLFHAYHVARDAGWTDGDYVGAVERLDSAIARIDGHGFRVTPFAPAERLADAVGIPVWVKDETGNVAGSHKARHLFGTLLELEVCGSDTYIAPHALAIASCGNAALAAAVVANAAGRHLVVYIPPDADPWIVARLRALGAQVTVCERRPGERGDPTYRALREAVHGEALAFTCQGSENGLAIEGGLTLGYELVSQLHDAGQRITDLVVQVGGGALASSLVQALGEAQLLGAIDTLPRIHTIQTQAAAPLARAYERVAALLDERAGGHAPHHVLSPAGGAALAEAARHRSQYMWPWEREPHSVATGILDDETYDWFAVVRGMLETGGEPVVVDEETLRAANRLARETTGIDVDPTGSAGLAGLIELQRRGRIGPDAVVAVIFTGVRRPTASGGGA